MNPAILAIFIFESTFYNSLGKTAVYMDCYMLSRYFFVFFHRLRFVRHYSTSFNGVFEPTLSTVNRRKFGLSDFAVALIDPNVGCPS